MLHEFSTIPKPSVARPVETLDLTHRQANSVPVGTGQGVWTDEPRCTKDGACGDRQVASADAASVTCIHCTGRALPSQQNRCAVYMSGHLFTAPCWLQYHVL